MLASRRLKKTPLVGNELRREVAVQGTLAPCRLKEAVVFVADLFC